MNTIRQSKAPRTFNQLSERLAAYGCELEEVSDGYMLCAPPGYLWREGDVSALLSLTHRRTTRENTNKQAIEDLWERATFGLYRPTAEELNSLQIYAEDLGDCPQGAPAEIQIK